MKRSASNLAERLDALSPEQIAEVEAFVEFLFYRSQERQLVREFANASSSSFEAIWNNPEDDIYNAI